MKVSTTRVQWIQRSIHLGQANKSQPHPSTGARVVVEPSEADEEVKGEVVKPEEQVKPVEERGAEEVNRVRSKDKVRVRFTQDTRVQDILTIPRSSPVSSTGFMGKVLIGAKSQEPVPGGIFMCQKPTTNEILTSSNKEMTTI